MKEILLSQGKVAIVDDSDFDQMSRLRWYALRCQRLWYAVHSFRKEGKRGLLYMHNVIMGGRTDHRDGDGLNNCRHNLRRATSMQNSRGFRRKAPGTTSQFRGVSWHAAAGKWAVQIQVEKRPLKLGLFDQEEDAAKAYDKEAASHFGEFAALNFPEKTQLTASALHGSIPELC